MNQTWDPAETLMCHDHDPLAAVSGGKANNSFF
jgi:hypothetical protein